MPQWNISVEQVIELPPQFILALDSLQEPGNLGTIIRTAHWFGIPLIVADEDTVDAFNPKVVQATMGSIVYVPIIYTDLKQFLQEIRKQHGNSIKILAADVEGTPLPEFTSQIMPDKWILIVGREAHGIDSSLKELIDHRLTIPAHADNPPDSLNVAVATGIALYELTKKRSASE